MKTNKIEASVLNNGVEFKCYLESIFSSEEKKYFWSLINDKINSFIIGGVIKDYIFNKQKQHRDIDIVVDIITDELREFICKKKIKKNNFDGYKIKIDDLVIDIWEVDNTWAFKNGNFLNTTNNYQFLPSTSFFNMTAVLFSLKKMKFYMDPLFNNFLNDLTLSIVYEKNPFPNLCIIKSFDFCNKFNLKLSRELKEYIIKYFDFYVDSFDEIQINHYGNVIYSNEELIEFRNKIEKSLRRAKQNRMDANCTQTAMSFQY